MLFYYNNKIRNNTVYIEPKAGKEITGNILCICRELENNIYNNYILYIGVQREYKNEIFEKLISYGISKCTLVECGSFKYFWCLATSKTILTDAALNPIYIKKSTQTVISTWHGTPVKAMGKECITELQALNQRLFLLSDFQICPGDYLPNKLLEVYSLTNIFEGKLVHCGYPRNDIFFCADSYQKMRKKLGLENSQIILYLPTFRGVAGKYNSGNHIEGIENLVADLGRRLKSNQVLYVKLHSFSDIELTIDNNNIFTIDSSYDIYDWLAAADILITDYSSVIFDFIHTNRKIVLYQYDFENYKSERGFGLNFSELGLPIAKTIDELVSLINSPISCDYTSIIAKFCAFDNSHATQLLCHHFFCGVKCIEICNHNLDEHKELIYAGDISKKENINKVIYYLSNKSVNHKKYYLLYHETEISTPSVMLESLPSDIEILGLVTYSQKTLLEMLYLVLYRNFKLCRKSIVRLYKREWIKHFGCYLTFKDITILDYDNKEIVELLRTHKNMQ